MTNSPTPILNTGSPTPPPLPPPPNRWFMGRAWDATKSAVGSKISNAVKAVGDGLGSGAVDGAKREFEQVFNPSSFITEVEKAFLRQPSQEVLNLKTLIEKALESPDKLTIEDIQAIYSHLKMLLQEEGKLLKVLKPNLSPEQTQLFNDIFLLFEEIATDEEIRDPDTLALYHKDIVNAYRQDLQKFDTLFGAILKENQGLLIKLMSSFQQRLLAIVNDESEKGLHKSLESGVNKVLDKALELLNSKLEAKGGLYDRFDIWLNDEEKGTLSRAMAFIHKKFMGDGGFMDQVDDRLTKEAHPILSNVRRKFGELRRALAGKHRKSIQNTSKELEQQLEQLFTHQALVFAKKPLTERDGTLLVQLKAQLPGFYSETPPDQNSMIVAAERGFTVINRYYESLEGTAARAGTIVQDKINETATDLKNMVSDALGFDSEKGGEASSFLDMGGSVLKKIMEKGVEAGSKQALASLSKILALGIEVVWGKMDNSPAFTQSKSALVTLKAALEKTTPETWKALEAAIEAASEALRPVKIHIHGIPIPIPTFGSGKTGKVGNAEEVYFDNLNILRDAINEAPAEHDNQNWEKLAEDEKNKLVGNLTKFLTMKHIYEDVCGLKSSDELFYTRLLTDSRKKGIEAPDDELKNLFFEKLKDDNVSVFMRIWAHLQYFFFGQIVKSNVQKASDIYFKEVFNYIKQHTGEHFSSLRNETTSNFTRYLSILGGAYKTIANNPQSTGRIEDMIKTELEKKEANLGLSSEELYLKFSEIVINKTLGTGISGWLGKKFIKNPEEIVRAIVDKSTDSIRDAQGYTHALNSVILEQLEEIWKLLRTEISQQNDPASKKQSNPDSKLSELKKSELSALVKNLFEILSKSKCQTTDELDKLLKGELWSDKANKAIDDFFIQDVIEKVTNLLAVCVQSLAEEKQLQKLTYKFASLVNRTFEMGQEVTVKQMQDEEHRIAELSNQILRFAINNAVEDKFDLSGIKQQKETNRLVDELHDRFKKFYTFSNPHPDAKNKDRIPGIKEDLAALANMNNQEFNSDEGIIKINKIIENTNAFEQQCYHSSFQSKGSDINSGNKNEIAKRYLGIAQQTKPLVKAVAQIKQHANSLQNKMTVVPYLNEIIKCAQEIQNPLFSSGGPSNEELALCETQMANLSTRLDAVKQFRTHGALVDKMTAEYRIMQTILIDVRKAAQANRFSQSFSSLEQIANNKKASLGPIAKNPALKAKLDQLRQEVTSSLDEAWLPQLLERLQTIENATFAEQVDTATHEFLDLCRNAASLATASIEAMRGKYAKVLQRLVDAVNATHLLDPDHDERARNGIRKSIEDAQGELEKLKKWEEENILQVPYLNFEPELPFLEMKQLQDWASGFVYDRVREKLKGFMRFLSREETYRYGLLHHLFLLPYIQKVEGKKLKTPNL